MARVGDRILESDFPSSPRDRAEGYRHLANQLIGWLTWAMFFADAAYPAIWRANGADLVSSWGGPNIDQNSLRARVSPDGVYRLSGTMGSCEDFILSVSNGQMHMGNTGIPREVMASDFGIRPGDDVEIILSAIRQPGNWVELTPDAQLIHIRAYHWDWPAKPPATLIIERLDTQGSAPQPPTPEQVATRLEEAASLIEHSIPYWNEYLHNARARLPAANVLGPPHQTPGGAHNIFYGFGFFRLGEDEALLIETEVPEDGYWDIQMYNLAWYEAFDFPNRTTSLNHRQATLSSDGKFRAVIAHRDPGVPNWLDTQGYREGQITYRWIKSSTQPAATATLISFGDIAALLPTDTPRIDAAARREEIRRRQVGIAWRNRV
jgi:hypothetical protein